MSSNINEILSEMSVNLSWIARHTNFNDSMYQRQAAIYTETLQKATPPKNNFTVVWDLLNVIVSPAVPQWGSFPCFVSGKEAYMDSYLSCAIFRLPFFLENIQFGYLCGLVIIPIMLISLFGKIKENYRWFLLNQALWDAITCYSFICEKPTVLSWSGGTYSKYTTCFYDGTSNNFLLDAFYILTKKSFRNAPYIPLFLLAFSRCISLYFPKFYHRHNQSWKVITFIVIFDIVAILFSGCLKLFNNFIGYLGSVEYHRCFDKFCLEYTNYDVGNIKCMKENEKYFQCSQECTFWLSNSLLGQQLLLISITPAMICLVLICVIALFIKLSTQLKYQLKHNRTAFLKTSKIAVVIFIQTITLAFYLSLTLTQQYLLISAWGPFFFDSRIFQSLSRTEFLLQSVATTTSFNIMRIFFDSFIVLLVLSGYRKRLFKFVVFLLTAYKNPFFGKNVKKYFQKSHRIVAVSTTTIKSYPITVLKTPPLK